MNIEKSDKVRTNYGIGEVIEDKVYKGFSSLKKIFILTSILVLMLVLTAFPKDVYAQENVVEPVVSHPDFTNIPALNKQDANQGIELLSIRRRLYLYNNTYYSDSQGRTLKTKWEKDTHQAPQYIDIISGGYGTRKSRRVNEDVPAKFDITVTGIAKPDGTEVSINSRKFRWEVPNYAQNDSIWIGKEYVNEAVQLWVCKGLVTEPVCYINIARIPTRDWN